MNLRVRFQCGEAPAGVWVFERPSVSLGGSLRDDLMMPGAPAHVASLVPLAGGCQLVCDERAVRVAAHGPDGEPLSLGATPLLPAGATIELVADGTTASVEIIDVRATVPRAARVLPAAPPATVDPAELSALRADLRATDRASAAEQVLAAWVRRHAQVAGVALAVAEGPGRFLAGDCAAPSRLDLCGHPGAYEALERGDDVQTPGAGGAERTWVPLRDGERLMGTVALDGASEGVRSLVHAVAPDLAAALRRLATCRAQVAVDEENRYFRERERKHTLLRELVAESPAMRRLHRDLSACVESPRPVLLRGEPGAGKELVARALHHLGPRAGGMLMTLHCGADDEAGLAIDLFGVRRVEAGGRPVTRRGAFELADHGTIFLDEVDLLTASLQARVMRAIGEGEIFRAGESEARPVDVRVVAATNEDLLEAADEGRFRRDLALALTGTVLALPPLRERVEDIEPLALAFLREFARRYRRAAVRLTPDALAALQQRRWPGNVRELRASIEFAVLRADARDTVLQLQHFEVT